MKSLLSPHLESLSIWDVFSGKQSISLGDESDWVDEDDDVPAFAGGLGQMGAMMSGGAQKIDSKPPVVTLSPAPRGQRGSKRTARNTGSFGGGIGGGALRQKGGQSPAECASPLPPDTVYESSVRDQNGTATATHGSFRTRFRRLRCSNVSIVQTAKNPKSQLTGRSPKRR